MFLINYRRFKMKNQSEHFKDIMLKLQMQMCIVLMLQKNVYVKNGLRNYFNGQDFDNKEIVVRTLALHFISIFTRFFFVKGVF